MATMGHWVAGLALGFGLVTAGAETESYKFIKTTDFGGAIEFTVVSSTELKEINDAIRIETRCIDKALMQAKDELRQREKKALPLGTPKSRKVETLSSFSSQETAQKELDNFLAKKEKREDAKMAREAKKSKLNANQKIDQDRRDERKALEEEALDLFKVKLESVVAAEKERMAAKAAAVPAAAGGNKPAGKD